MRDIVRASAFKADFKREKKGRHRETIEADLTAILEFLVADKPLPARCQDHGLSGNWKNHRDCHIKPDLMLIYRKVDPNAKGKKRERPTLELVRLGSHSELGI